MAQRITLSKQELKRQKDLLKRFKRYLPILTLKMQQLQLHLNRIESQLRQKIKERDAYIERNREWTAVFGERVDIERYVRIEDVRLTYENLAGTSIPSLLSIQFAEQPCDLYRTPLWIDHGISYLKERLNLDAEVRVLETQRALIDQELRTTTQRVNLFERIRIPETEASINKIVIYLGDQYTAAVVRGKIAKKKIIERAAV